jgi:hypothetical protein
MGVGYLEAGSRQCFHRALDVVLGYEQVYVVVDLRLALEVKGDRNSTHDERGDVTLLERSVRVSEGAAQLSFRFR